MSLVSKTSRRNVFLFSFYDIANTVYSQIIQSTIILRYIQIIGQKENGLSYSKATFVFTTVQALSQILVVLLIPLIGAMADRMGRRKPLVISITGITLISTSMLWVHKNIVTAMALFVIANLAYWAALAVYDAMIPALSAEEDLGKTSGIAMGLITDDKGNFAVLSDILGDEDHFGDMDFKVTGTTDGITACQMDIKVDGLPYEILKQALMQAKEGRAHILNKMLETISEPRAEFKSHVPGITSILIPGDLIGTVIGPGGKMIQQIQKDTQTTITIEEIDGLGNVVIMGPTQDAISDAKEYIKGLTAVPEVGTVYQGKVKKIVDFGAFVEILPGKDGLLHISEISYERTNKVEDVLKEGQEIEVKLIGIDSRTKKLKLSRKALLPKPERKDDDKK